jgi:hypothetical protein
LERKEHIRLLFDKYLVNKHTAEELDELLNYFNLDQDRIELTGLISKEMGKEAAVGDQGELIETIAGRLEKKVFAKTRPKPLIKKLQWPLTIAAMLTLGLTLLGYIYFARYNKTTIGPQLTQNHNDVPPGGNRAILTLAGGKKISLSDARNGTLLTEGGIIIIKTADGQLAYSTDNTELKSPLAYNTIETPNGGQYQVQLPDGTKVWLNAASSLKYPTSFNSKGERRVSLTGEAYFEVAHNRKAPFIVSTAHQEVKVLGTHFNINSYSNEGKTITTLQQGSVKVTSAKSSEIIIPGQQASSMTNWTGLWPQGLRSLLLERAPQDGSLPNMIPSGVLPIPPGSKQKILTAMPGIATRIRYMTNINGSSETYRVP